jgi:7-keto-8-aminopelargonate synthetase-like enzyme
MDGDFAPLSEICDLVDQLLPRKNGHIIVDEAHATGLYGPNGRGIVALLGLETRITARLHTFGKALGASGGALSREAKAWLGHLLTFLVYSYLSDKQGRSGIFSKLLETAGVHHSNDPCEYSQLTYGI